MDTIEDAVDNKKKIRETRKTIKRIHKEVRLVFKKNISNLRKEFSRSLQERFEIDEHKLFEQMKKKRTRTPETVQKLKTLIFKEATEYSIRFHLMEAYEVAHSQIKGCELWNILNECVFFKCDTKIEPTDQALDQTDVLQTLCRFYHKSADLTLLSNPYKRNQSRRSKRTFWICMEEALLHLNPEETLLNKDDVEECLRQWNIDNDLEFFRF